MAKKVKDDLSELQRGIAFAISQTSISAEPVKVELIGEQENIVKVDNQIVQKINRPKRKLSRTEKLLDSQPGKNGKLVHGNHIESLKLVLAKKETDIKNSISIKDFLNKG